MGLDEHIRNGYAALQVGVLAFMARIFVTADVKPWPAIEGAFMDISRVVKGSVISEAISLIDDCPYLACRRLYGNTCGISNSRGIDLLVRTVGIKRQNISAAFFAVPGGAERMSLIPPVCLNV